MSSDEQTEIERRARALFGESVEALDAETRSRLNRARQAAVAEARRARPQAWRQWLPLAAAASVALVAIVLWRAPGSARPTAGSVRLALPRGPRRCRDGAGDGLFRGQRKDALFPGAPRIAHEAR